MKAAISAVLLLFVLTATAQTQTKFTMDCDKGVCTMSEEDANRLQASLSLLGVSST